MKVHRLLPAILFLVPLAWFPPAARADAPDWLQAAAASAASLPKYPPETKEVELLDDETITIQTNGEIVWHLRVACKILRTSGCSKGEFVAYYNKDSKITSFKGWTLPAVGKAYEVKDKDAVDFADVDAQSFSDDRYRVLALPAAQPGNIVGFEVELKERPELLQREWHFQSDTPVVVSRYTLQLPPGWEYKTYWLNFAEVQPQRQGDNSWQWELHNIPGIEVEKEMPPRESLEGRMVIDYFPSDPAIRQKTFDSWNDFGLWYLQLTSDRRNDSPEIAAKVKELTANAATTLDKVKALAAWVQQDIRYYAIEIGIGGHQPHPAAQIFANRYGDCKDKATLLSTMLKDIGVDSYYVVINHRRGKIRGNDPPWDGFDHVILAIRIPAGVPTTQLYATYNDPQLGNLLFFDPTNDLVPLGYLDQGLQLNYGLLVTDTGGELVELPLLPGSTNRLARSAELSLAPDGTLHGKVHEIRWGEPAFFTRAAILGDSSTSSPKALESFLSNFLEGFQLVNDSVENLHKYDQTLVVDYEFSAPNYAQSSGDLLLVRPRVLGAKGSALLEEKERKYPVELGAATVQTDTFEIALPPGYVVDELPPPVHADYPFATYTSKVECDGKVLRYSRTFEVKHMDVPTDQLSDLKRFYEQVAQDENNSAVLKRAAN
jgi:hypothetical protein